MSAIPFDIDADASRLADRRRPTALISIVTAFYNEEDSIPTYFQVLEETAAALPCRVEFVCVNDGSRDGTPSLLRAHAANARHVRVIELSRNFGKEAAITAGLAQARGDAAVVIDADLQDPPALIGDFVRKWREGFDVVYGIRRCRRSDSWLKRVTAWAFYSLFARLADTGLPAGAGDFRLMDRRALDAFLAMPERNRFLKGLFAWIGFRQTGVEFARPARVAGRSAWSYFKLVNLAFDGITGFSIAPLRLSSLFGALVSLMAFVYAMMLIVRTLVWGADVPGYASVMVVMMFLGGMQLLCLGLIGEYLGRLYIESKKRPLYVVSDVHEGEAHPERIEGAGNLVPLRPASESRAM